MNQNKLILDDLMIEFIYYINEKIGKDKINIIMEIGAYKGNNSKYFKQQFPNSKIICIDANKEYYNSYLKNIEEIMAVNCAIGSEDCIKTFFLKKIDGLHSLYDRGAEYGTEKEDTQVWTIPTLCKNLKINIPDIIKIDAEGATYDILQGLGNKLQTLKGLLIETESHEFFKGQKTHYYVEKLLLNNNFKCLLTHSAEIYNNKFQYETIWLKNE